MEQPCYKCGQAVDEGVAFCPHCSAPQIRVVVAQPVAVPTQLAEITASPAGSVALSASQTVPVLAVPMEWSRAVRPCGMAALVASLLMAMGLNPFVAMLSVGFLAVLFFRQREAGVPVKALSGAGLGAIAGLLWFAISSALEAMAVIFLHKGPEIRAQLIAKIDQTAAQTSDPQVLAMFDRLKTPAGLELAILSGVLFALLAGIALGGLGGALAAAIFGRREKHGPS